jgi:Gametolysin peptidase M11
MRHAAAGTLTGYNAGDTLYQYRDYSDIMGIGGLGLRLLNAGHMEQMGWTPTSQILTVTGNGTFQIAPLATFPADTTLPTILKIRKPDTSEYFYISYRRRMGFDANLDIGYVDKVNIHRYAGGGVLSYFIKALADGESLQDPTNNIVITMNSHNNTSATVSINSSKFLQ